MARPYSRVYWSVLDDPKFDGIRDDVRLLGAWVALLLYSDLAYPASTYRPPFVPLVAFKRLVAAGLVDELSGKRYRIHGLASEREMRSQSARNAAASRWDMPSKAEQSNSKAKHTDADANASTSDWGSKRPRPNTVDRDPLYRQMRDAIKAKEKDDA